MSDTKSVDHIVTSLLGGFFEGTSVVTGQYFGKELIKGMEDRLVDIGVPMEDIQKRRHFSFMPTILPWSYRDKHLEAEAHSQGRSLMDWVVNKFLEEQCGPIPHPVQSQISLIPELRIYMLQAYEKVISITNRYIEKNNRTLLGQIDLSRYPMSLKNPRNAGSN